jgi:hypothetical protein
VSGPVNVHGPLSRHAKTRRRVSSTPDLKQALELSRRAIGTVARTEVDRARLGTAIWSRYGEGEDGVYSWRMWRAAWQALRWMQTGGVEPVGAARVRAKVFYKSDARWTGRSHVDRPPVCGVPSARHGVDRRGQRRRVAGPIYLLCRDRVS